MSKRSVSETIDDWKFACGVLKTSEKGTTYYTVPIENQRGRFLDLIQTLSDYGYTQQEVSNASTNTLIAKACWSDLITKLSAKSIKKNRDISTSIWREAVKEFYRRPISKFVAPVREEPTFTPTPSFTKRKYEISDIVNPRDRIVIDTSDIIDAEKDEEFLKELDAIGGDVNE